MNNSNKIRLNPFVIFCQKVIPLAFDESMSYYECLCALVSFLQEKVIPAVNNNAEAVTELQEQFVILKNYVDTYFDNLDIQQEIDNKLDEMAESGQLADIIAQYLELAGILAYNTKADMKDAENIADGSFCKTYGDLEYNDGKGKFYKIRTLTTGDVIDDVNIIALENYPTLIAELIPDYYIENLNTRVENVESEMATLQDYFNIKPTNLFFYDAGNVATQGCCVDEDNILYVAKMGSSGYGTLLKFNLSTKAYVGETSSFLLYHGNDMAYLNGNIYIASATNSAGQTNNKKIVCYNISSGTATELNPFDALSEYYLGFISTYDDTHLLCGLSTQNSASVTIDNYNYYILDLTDNSYVELTYTNTKNIPVNYYTYVQSLEYLNGYVYIETSFNNSIIKLKLNSDNTLDVDNIFSFNTFDEFNQPIGEIEGLCKIPSGIYGDDTLVMTTQVWETSLRDNLTIQGYLINTETNLPSMLYPTVYELNGVNWRDVLVVDSTSTSIYENGTATYPFKSLARAINFFQQTKFSVFGYIRIDHGATFTLGQQTNKVIKLVNNTGAKVTFASGVQFTNCQTMLYSGSASVNTGYVFAGPCIVLGGNGFIQFGTYNGQVRVSEQGNFNFYGGVISISPSITYAIETDVCSNVHIMLDSVSGYTTKMMTIQGNSLVWLNATLYTANSWDKSYSSIVYGP